jgi:serine/threonine protein kinase
MIGKVLQSRYQIVQNLGSGVFGQTYIAVDIEQPHNPKCVVKLIKVTSNQPSYLETLRLRFLTETETLRLLGHHNQIPELVTCFEENERFYLVQEFIEGHALSAELPMHRSGNAWSEREVVKFLEDVLGILQFIHAQGVIHCDIKPENLIRRACDGKLVLIDFGSIQPIDFGTDSILPIYRIPVTSLGYIPPEQFISQTQPNSDIYALGMIAIQAITGLTPLQLKVDPHTNNIFWRTSHTQVSDYLAAVLSKMICYDFKGRFQSATEVLQVLKQMTVDKEPQTIDAEYTLFVDPVADAHPGRPISEKSSPLLTGMKVGLAANSLVMGLGVYSLVNSPVAHSETEALYKATEEYQSGDLDKAIALVKSIPATSTIYPEAQATVGEWQHQWQIAGEQYQIAEKAYQEQRWSDVLRASAKVPDILYWQSKTDQLVKQARVNVESETKGLLAKAYERAIEKDFNTALEYLHQIPENSSHGSIVQQKLAEYNQKKHIRAAYFLQKAYQKAEARDFNTAVKLLQQVPKDTPIYATAQAKVIEYSQKQRLQGDGQKIASLTPISDKVSRSEVQTKSTLTPFIRSTATSLQDLQPGNYMQEVNIR